MKGRRRRQREAKARVASRAQRRRPYLLSAGPHTSTYRTGKWSKEELSVIEGSVEQSTPLGINIKEN